MHSKLKEEQKIFEEFELSEESKRVDDKFAQLLHSYTDLAKDHI